MTRVWPKLLIVCSQNFKPIHDWHINIEQDHNAQLETHSTELPERFRAGLPHVKGAPTAVYITPPKHQENLT